MAGHHGPSYIKVYFILLVLFIISVLGPEMADTLFDADQVIAKKVLVLSTAFGIAFVKAYYVIAYFMHLKFEVKYVNYMLGTTVVFMMLFFAGVAGDVMNHKGRNWTNTAAAGEVQRALKEIEARKAQEQVAFANLVAVPNSVVSWKKSGHQKYQMPIDSAMSAVVKMSNGRTNRQATFFRHSGETPREKSARKAHESKLKVDFDKLLVEKPEMAQPNADQVAAGKKYYQTSQCAGCHSADGSKLVGPSFKGLANRPLYGYVQKRGEDKATLTVMRADRAYFEQSIEKPKAVVVKGYPASMPGITVNAKDRDALWAYIQSLSL